MPDARSAFAKLREDYFDALRDAIVESAKESEEDMLLAQDLEIADRLLALRRAIYLSLILQRAGDLALLEQFAERVHPVAILSRYAGLRSLVEELEQLVVHVRELHTAQHLLELARRREEQLQYVERMRRLRRRARQRGGSIHAAITLAVLGMTASKIRATKMS